MDLFTISNRDATIEFKVDLNGKAYTQDKINFIKMIRNSMGCGLKEAKDFCDLFVHELNKLQITPESMKSKIREELIDISDPVELMSIMRNIRQIKHNRSVLGSFDHNGNYNRF